MYQIHVTAGGSQQTHSIRALSGRGGSPSAVSVSPDGNAANREYRAVWTSMPLSPSVATEQLDAAARLSISAADRRATRILVPESALRPQLEITDRHGQPITQTQAWIVGKRVQLRVRVRVGEGSQATTSTEGLEQARWTIPGETVGTYTRTRSRARTTPADTTGPEVSFYWIAGTPSGQRRTVRVRARVQGRQLSATAEFRVQSPTVASFELQTCGTVTLALAVRGSLVQMICQKVVRNTPTKPGMRGAARVQAPSVSGGQIGVTQLIHLNRFLKETASNRSEWNVSRSSGFVLDDAYGIIYDKRRGNGHTSADTGAPVSAGGSAELPAGMHEDSPSVYLCETAGLRRREPVSQLTPSGSARPRPVHEGRGHDRFRTFLMFRPSGDDSIWVTLSYAEWSWQGTWSAERQIRGGGYGDIAELGSTSPSANGRASSDLPTWQDYAEHLFGR